MKNKVFTRKTAAEKRRHLSSVLRYAAGGALDDDMIGRILPKVAIHRQYTVSAYSDRLAFQQAVAHARTGNAPLSVVYARSGRGPVTAVITPRETGDVNKSKRAIYICLPNLSYRKGVKPWARASRNG